MKKISDAKCLHLGLKVSPVRVGDEDYRFSCLPAHVLSPKEDTDKKNFVFVGTAETLLEFFASQGISKEQAFQNFPDIKMGLDRMSLIRFVDKRFAHHVSTPNPDPVLASEDEKILTDMRASVGSFISFEDYVEQSKASVQKTVKRGM